VAKTQSSYGQDKDVGAGLLMRACLMAHVNQELVKHGWCWWYPEYAPDNVILAELQRRARNQALG